MNNADMKKVLIIGFGIGGLSSGIIEEKGSRITVVVCSPYRRKIAERKTYQHPQGDGDWNDRLEKRSRLLPAGA